MKKTIGQRFLSVLLCLVMVVSCLPAASMMPAIAVGESRLAGLTRVADPSTKDSWQDYYGTGADISTDNAGGIWTDKSVFTDASAFSNVTTDSQGNPVTVTMANGEDMLVALSAMGSNMTVTGQSSVPTDTMLVLDVSGSMNDNEGNNDVAQELAEAANTTIHTLLSNNPNNRVGVVLYSGPNRVNGAASANDAVVLLPLGRYTTGADNVYVSYSRSGDNETIGIDSDVRNASNARPTSVSKRVEGATYIQKGVILAMNQFTAADNQIAPSGVAHKPILVLMSDGAPTISDTDFTNPGSYDLGSGSSTSAAQGFVNQLTLAYAKSQIQAKYNTKPLFYTVGLGTTNDPVATSVLDPANSNSGINEFWRQYNAASAGGTVAVEGSGNRATRVTKISASLEQNYVDKYIAVNASTDLAQGLKDAFAQVVSDINLQSKYFPTLVGSSQDLSGYVSFVDQIGSYLSVTDVKGILLHEQLHTGQNLAKNFVEGGGILGTEAAPTAAGTALMRSVRDRLGLADDEAARSLIRNAYYYGQFSYDPQTGAFSNYIGWYADAQGKYMGFYQEGVTVLPAEAVYTVKSYGFLGETDPEHGVLASDLMYTTVQVRHHIETGEEELILKIPASLLPTVTYEVTLDQNGDLQGLNRTGATYPFRLLYEVGLDRHINAVNLTEYVSQEYLAANTNPDGSVNFYSNQYEADGSTGYGKVNTYSYFNPSHQNDKYYFQSHTLIYRDQNGTLYTGSTAPGSYSGALYRQHTSYKKTNGQLITDVHYHELSATAKGAALRTEGDNSWYVPEDTVYTFTTGYVIDKGANNPTGTLPYAKLPFVDVYGHSVTETNHSFTIGSTLGNNGRLTLLPATGIKLTKELAETAENASDRFTFLISGDTANAQAVRMDENGQILSQEALTNGQVTLTAGESVYIIGLSAGSYTVTEAAHPDYSVSAVTVNGTAQNGDVANATVTARQLTGIVFTNAPKGTGNLLITKEIRHSSHGHMVPDALLAQPFTVTVNVGTALAGQSFKTLVGTTEGSVTVGTDGSFTATITHGNTLEILALPEDTTVTVTETGVAAPFAFDYILTRDHSGAEQDRDNTVTIGTDTNSTAVVHNLYTPAAATADLDVQITKSFLIESALSSATFDFAAQYWNGQTWEDRSTGSITYSGDSGTKTLVLQDVLKNVTYTEAGDYAYRVIEVIPAEKLPGVSYDRTEYNFTVRVTDNGGQLVAAIIDDNQPVTGAYQAAFTNTYHTAPVSLDVQKILDITSGDAEVPKSGFLFEAYVADQSFAPVDNTADLTVRSDATGRARFAATYNRTGTFYYVVKEKDEGRSGWTYDDTEYHVTVVVTDDGTGDLSATVTTVKAGSTEPITGMLTFTNRYDPTDATVDLSTAVRKELTGKTLAAGDFTFALFEHGAYSHSSAAKALLTGTNAADGSVALGSLTFDRIGIYEYDIVEINTGKGGITYDSRIFDLVVEVTDDHNGKLSATWYFEDEPSQTVTFRNSYTVSAASYTVTGSKQLTGKALINDEFTFTLVPVDAGGNPLAGGQVLQATNTMDGSFAFPALTYTQAGTYYYQVSELQQATTGGITFDRTVYTVCVTVTDNGSGQLVATATVDGQPNKTVSFTNHYVPAKTSGTIPGNKVLEGKVLGAGAYSFQLFDSNASWENLGAKGQPVTNGADGTFHFPEIEYTRAGTYYYLVSEVNGGKTIDGVTYDASVFRVRVTVTDDLKGQLHAETVVFDQDGIPQIGVEFVNTYAVIGDASLVLSGSKTLTGAELTDGKFTFQLLDESGAVVTSGTNTGSTYTLRLNYTAAEALGKTYTYTLKEQYAGQTLAGITYDSKSYTVTVKVTDDGVGGIRLTVTTDGQQTTENKVTTVTGLNFTNTYYAQPTSLTLSGAKELTGKTLRVNDFIFRLYAADNRFNPTGEALSATRNDGKGAITFAAQTFTQAGTYYFVVREDNAGQTISGVTYDAAESRVTVTVTDNGKGQLEVTQVVYQKADATGVTSANGITFTNRYDAEDAAVTFSGKKTLTGKSLEAGQFTFALQQTDSSFASLAGSAAVQTVNGADGSFAFSALTFDTEGTYYYTVSEVKGSLGGVTYDSTVYKLTVKVTDKDGKLEATVTGGTPSALNFQNNYKAAATAPVDLDGIKTVSGQWTLKADQFTFQLFAADENFVIQGSALQTVSNNANGGFSFADVSFETAGKHSFVIKESSDAPIPGMTYDETVYHLSVTVTDDGEGQLEVTDAKLQKVTADATTEASELRFANSYDAADATLTLAGTKELTGKALEEGAFTFQLQQTDGNFTALEGSLPKQAVNAADGSFTFDAITYDTVGTYYYTVTELDTGNERTTFDKTVYQVTVTVTDKNGVLKAVATYGQAQAIVFHNVYTPKPADLPIALNVQKTVKNTGKETIGPEGFTFVLEESADAKLEAVTDAEGKAGFALTATEDMIGQSFTLKLYEKNDGKAHVTYSEALYTYTIAISLSNDNRLVATITCNGEAVESGHTAQFENVYDYTVPQTPVTGDSMNLVLWFSLLTVSGLAMAAAVIFRKKFL